MNTNKNRFGMLATLILIVTAQAALGALTDNNTRYYKLEESSGSVAVDETGTQNGTYNGDVPTAVTGIIDNGQSFDGVGDYINITTPISGEDGSVSFWVNRSDIGADNEWMWGYVNSGDANTINAFMWGSSSDGVTLTVGNSGGTRCQTEGSAVDDGQWHHLVFTWDLSGRCITYIDGAVDVNVSAPGGSFSVFDDFFIGARENGGSPNNPLTGDMDEVSVWDRVISKAEVQELYANGSPGSEQQYPYTAISINLTTTGITPSSPESDDVLTSNATYTSANGVAANITANWTLNGAELEVDTFNDVANGTTVSANFSCNFWNCSNQDNVTVTWNATNANSSTVTTDSVKIQDLGRLVVYASEVITGNAIQTFNTTSPVNVRTTTGIINITLNISNYTLTVDASESGYINIKSQSIEVKFNQTTTVNLTGFATHNLTLDVEDTSGSAVNTYGATINTSSYGGYAANKQSSGTQSYFEVLNATYTITIENATENGTEYAKQSTTRLIENTTQTETITLQLTNSFNLEFLDEQTRLLVDDRNITVKFISDLEASNHTTENGTLFVDAFMPAEIEITYNAPGYEERSYYHFLDNQSFNNITLYLLNTTASTQIIVTNLDESGIEVEGVTTIVKRGYITGGVEIFETVEMDKTDFGGEAVFNLETGTVPYKWLVVNNVEDNTVLFISDPGEVTSAALEFKLSVSGDALSTFNYIIGQGNTGLITTRPSYDNTTKLWSAGFEVTTSNVWSEICLKVEEINDFGKRKVNETCTTANTATLTTGHDGEQPSIATLTMKTPSNEEIPLDTQQYQPSQPWKEGGGDSVLAATWITTTVGLAFLTNPVALTIAATLAFLSAIAMGLFGLSWVAFVPILITAGVLIFKMNNVSLTGGRPP